MLLDGARILGRTDPAARSARVLVGVVDQPGLRDGKLSLNHKDGSGSYASATEFVDCQDDSTIDEWKTALGFVDDSARPFAGQSIVVEDASPDTCLALIALARRLHHCRLQQAWLDYSRRWERGFTDSTGIPQESFGALLTALVHVEFQDDASRGHTAPPTAYATALIDGVSYAAGLVELDLDPARLPRVLRHAQPALHDLHARAHSRLAYEEIVYRRLKASATRIQLAVHMAESHRKTLVDAILFSETVFTSSLKVFIRSDPATFTGRGYAFQALYRPDLPMTGNDLTVSTDPAAGLDLRDLWAELERMEEERWRAFADRPGGFPRPRGADGPGDRILLSHGESWSSAAPCHQPWYDDKGRRTLLAAPRGVEHDGSYVPGTRLSWSDVKDAIWRVYAPTLGLRLRPLGDTGQGHSLTAPAEQTGGLRTELIDGSGLYVVCVERVYGHHDDVVLWTPTLTAACAAFIDTGGTSIDSLAPADGFDLVEDRGGMAIVSERGVMLLRMSPDLSFPVEAARAAMTRVGTKIKSAADLETAIQGPLRHLVETAIGTGSDTAKRQALKEIFARKLRVRRAWRDAQNTEPDPLVRRIRDLCETRWGARRRLDAALAEIDELERMVVSSSEVRANAVLNKLAVYGLPLSLAGNVLGGLIVVTNGIFEGVAVPVLLGYVAVATTIGIPIWLYALVQRRKWRMSAGD